MSIAYSSITILTSEEARWKGMTLHDAVVNLVRGRKIAARCHVTRRIAGSYESDEVATHSIVDLSANLPLEIVSCYRQRRSTHSWPNWIRW